MNVPQTLQSHIPSWRSAISDSRTFNHAATDTRLPVQDSISTLARSKELSGLSLLRFPRVHTSRRLGRYAVERFCLMDRARVEACFLSFQKGTTLRNENCVSIVRVCGINPYVLQNVYSSLSLPTHYVLVGRLKRSPMNDTAVPRSLAPMSLQQLINQFCPYPVDNL